MSSLARSAVRCSFSSFGHSRTATMSVTLPSSLGDVWVGHDLPAEEPSCLPSCRPHLGDAVDVTGPDELDVLVIDLQVARDRQGKFVRFWQLILSPTFFRHVLTNAVIRIVVIHRRGGQAVGADELS
jgi:hypothetical protein